MCKNCCNFAADFAPMSEQSHHIVDLSRLSTGTHRFDIQLDDAFFVSVEKSEILGGSVSAQATLNLREDDYTLSIAVRGAVSVVCDRCLDAMTLDIDAAETMSPNDGLMNDDEAMPRNDEIDLSWLAYEIVSINIPLVHCHPTGACNPQMDLLLQSHLCDEPDPDVDKT